MPKPYKALVFIGLLVVAGFMRETLFVRITWQQAVVAGQAYAPPKHWLFGFLEHFNAAQLIQLKYASTVLFSGVFWLLCLLSVKWFFNQKTNFTLVHICFGVLFSMGVLVYLLGYVFPGQQNWYTLSRWIMGVIETPLCVALLYPVLWLKTKTAQ